MDSGLKSNWMSLVPRLAFHLLSLALPTTYGFDAVRALLPGTLPLGATAAVLVGFMFPMLTLGWQLFWVDESGAGSGTRSGCTDRSPSSAVPPPETGYPGEERP